MQEIMRIRHGQDKQHINVPICTTLLQLSQKIGFDKAHEPLIALVNNKEKPMDTPLTANCDVTFIHANTPAGKRAINQTLLLVLKKAAQELYPQAQLINRFPYGTGFYCQLDEQSQLLSSDIDKLRARMQEIIEQDLRIENCQFPTQEAIARFEADGMHQFAELLKHAEHLYTKFVQLEQTRAYFTSPTLIRTGLLTNFELKPLMQGMWLHTPTETTPHTLRDIKPMPIMKTIIEQKKKENNQTGIHSLSDFNNSICQGQASELIIFFEALQMKHLNTIAKSIVEKEAKMILLAGPSSSGKTTTSKRLAVQLKVYGKNPHTLSLDNYFVNREDSPRDENGNFNFESFDNIDLQLFNTQMTALLTGKQIELPRYDFQTGKRVYEGQMMQIGPDDVIIFEGTHALNPNLTSQINEKDKFRIYVSASSSVPLDNLNYISSRDLRLMRRIIRDYNYRGYSAQQTIQRLPSVSAGEDEYISPFREYADAAFNCTLPYETFAIKQQLTHILSQVSSNCSEYAEAKRLLNILQWFKAIPLDHIPPTSLLREFVGNSAFKY